MTEQTLEMCWKTGFFHFVEVGVCFLELYSAMSLESGRFLNVNSMYNSLPRLLHDTSHNTTSFGHSLKTFFSQSTSA